MSSKDNNKDKSTGFWDAIKQGYNEEDAAIKKDTAPLYQKLSEGAVEGVVETIAHPVRWLRSLLK